MKLTVYINVPHSVLFKCVDTHIRVHFKATYSSIECIHIDQAKESLPINLRDVISEAVKGLRCFHESLKLKEKHSVWLISFTSTRVMQGPPCTVLFLNDNPLETRAKYFLSSTLLTCGDDREQNLAAAKSLNTMMKQLFVSRRHLQYDGSKRRVSNKQPLVINPCLRVKSN